MDACPTSGLVGLLLKPSSIVFASAAPAPKSVFASPNPSESSELVGLAMVQRCDRSVDNREVCVSGFTRPAPSSSKVTFICVRVTSPAVVVALLFYLKGVLGG